MEQRINYKLDMHGTKFINIRDLMIVTDPVTRDYIQENIRIWEDFSNK